MAGTMISGYEIIRCLGEGASGIVHLAQDTQLRRRVAIKTLREPGDDLVLHEARAAARLDHPHIARVHHVVHADGKTHIVMEYVDGQTVAERLHAGPYPAELVRRLGGQLAAGLAHAHAHGIVHRDIKPANIFVCDDSSAKILDFGLARRVRVVDSTASTTDASSGLVDFGPFAGTPAYMAPEIFAGQEAGALTDIYSLGATLFEMLTGRRPFPAPDRAALIRQVTTSPTPHASDVNHAVPRALGDVVQKAMARQPEHRHQSAEALERALGSPGAGRAWRRWLLPGSVGALALLALLRIAPGSGPATKPPVLVVLPFACSSQDSLDVALAKGMTFTVTSRLGQLALAVVPPSQIDLEDRDRANAAHIMRTVGANVALEGSLQRVGDRLRIALSLLRSGGNTVVWARTVDGDAAEAFSLQGEVVEALSSGLDSLRILARRTPPAVVRVLRSPSTTNLSALAEYGNAQDLLQNFNVGQNLDIAIEMFRRSATRDPQFAGATAGLGQAYIRKFDITRDTTYIGLAEAAVHRAEAQFPDDPAVPLVRGALADRRGRYEEAEGIFRLLTRSMPESDVPWAALAACLRQTARPERAIEPMTMAIQRRPDYWEHHYELGRLYQKLNRRREALKELRTVIQLQPESYWGYSAIAVVYYELGDTARAGEYARKTLSRNPGVSALTLLGNREFDLGRYAESATFFERCTTLRPMDPRVWRNLADARLAAGDTAAAHAEFRRILSLTEGLLAKNARSAGDLRMKAYALAQLGSFDEARRVIDAALAQSPDDPALLYMKATIEALAGSGEPALDALARSIEKGASPSIARSDFNFRSLGQSPEFQKLVAVH